MSIAVYSALFGDYDKVQPAIWDNSFLFTDQDIKSNGWTILDCSYSQSRPNEDN